MADTSVETAIDKPKSVTVDGTTVTQHDLEDMIAAEKFRLSKAAAAVGPSTLLGRSAQIKPPGAV